MKAAFYFSESGMQSLQAAGITPGWIRAWLMQAGASQVDVGMMSDKALDKQAYQWLVCFGSASDLSSVALADGKRMGTRLDGGYNILGCKETTLINADRTLWWYEKDGSTVLLVPLGDMAYQRHIWMNILAPNRIDGPMIVSTDASGDILLEAGLSASFGPSQGEENLVLSENGKLPEEALLDVCRSKGFKLRLMESCTGGGIAERVTRIPGASDMLDAGWVSYSDSAKSRLLGVSPDLIEEQGAVSEAVVQEMVAYGQAGQTVCLAVSGIAGPDHDHQALGTVWFAYGMNNKATKSVKGVFPGSRADVRLAAVNYGMGLLIQVLDGNG